MSTGKPGPELSSHSPKELTGFGGGLGAQDRAHRRGWEQVEPDSPGRREGEGTENEGQAQERSSFWGRHQLAARTIQVGGRLRTYQGTGKLSG